MTVGLEMQVKRAEATRGGGRALAATIAIVLAASFLTIPIARADAADQQQASRADTGPLVPFEAITYQDIKLPKGIRYWEPSYAPDGKNIVFTNLVDGTVWAVDSGGRDVQCITCGFTDRPDISSAFTYVFPDNERLLIANEVGDQVAVLECAPSVFDCQQHAFRKVDFSADQSLLALKPDVGRRTFHLAPDGMHLGYNIQRLDTLLMVVGKLERRGSTYALTNPRAINPPAPTSLFDRSSRRWNNASMIAEFKSFADGGASVIYVATEGLNPDQYKIDLTTGEITRLTFHPDWDEDGSLSLDNKHLVTATWRGQEKIEALGIFPNKSFLFYPFAAAAASYYVGSPVGVACDLQPRLLDPRGDVDGTRGGQPLDLAQPDKAIYPSLNLAGVSMWSPDSTKVILQQRKIGKVPSGANPSYLEKGPAPDYIRVAKLGTTPTKPEPTVVTKVGSWSKTPQQYTGAFALPGVNTVDGEDSGTATIARLGNPGVFLGKVTYKNYSDDGKIFISGTEKLSGSTLIGDLAYTTDLIARDASGKEVGHSRANLKFTTKFPAPSRDQLLNELSGTIDTKFAGKRFTKLGKSEPCPDLLPTASPLTVAAKATKGGREGREVKVTVKSSIGSDTRSVRNATVTVAGQAARTDERGVAVIRLSRSTKAGVFTVKATAGETFKVGKVSVRVPGS